MRNKKKIIFCLALVVLSLIIALSGCGKSSTAKISTEPIDVKIIDISPIPAIVDQGSVVVLKINLENNYEEYEMECLGDLDIGTMCESEAERCLRTQTKEKKVSGHVEKTIKLDPLSKEELDYTLYIPDYEGKLDFTSKIIGRLIVRCHGPCVANRKPACIPLGDLKPIDINMTVRRD